MTRPPPKGLSSKEFVSFLPILHTFFQKQTVISDFVEPKHPECDGPFFTKIQNTLLKTPFRRQKKAKNIF